MLGKIWAQHRIRAMDATRSLVHVDRHLIHEVSSRAAFSALAASGRGVAQPALTVAMVDHIASTRPGRDSTGVPGAAEMIGDLRDAARRNGIVLFDIDDPRQGIVHVVAPERGIVLPGQIAVCGDSHTCTLGGLGALAFGIGTTEIAHVLATQTLVASRPRSLRITILGRPPAGVGAKDVAMGIIGRFGTRIGLGHAAEFAGEWVRELPVEQRLTLCNHAIEFGARAAFVAPDDTLFAYLRGRPDAPQGAAFDLACTDWRALASDPDAAFDTEIAFDASALRPLVTWGTSPDQIVPLDGAVPDPATAANAAQSDAWAAALAYMGLSPGVPLRGLPLDRVFIGSCANARLSDLAEAAEVLRGRRVAAGVRVMVVPGSVAVQRAAEAAGIADIIRAAGAEWREPGCSMCPGMNEDASAPGERVLSTSNRNFEGRQGRGVRTHLAGPAVAAASAVLGAIGGPEHLA